MITTPKVEEYAPHQATVEEHRVPGEKLVARVRELLHEGNVRRLIVKSEDGTILMELPLTIGVMGALLLPVWVALGAIAALAAHYRIGVETAPVERGPARAEPYAFHCRPDV